MILLAAWHRFCRDKPGIQRVRATRLAYAAGLVATTWYVSMGHLITLNMGSMSWNDNLRVYFKGMTLGVFS
jgi:hypothetical protein